MAKEKFDYFKAFEKQAELTSQEAIILRDALRNYTQSSEILEVMTRAHEVEHDGDEINHRIFNNVAIEFITPIEREDIIELAARMDDILDYIEDIITNFYTYDVVNMRSEALEFADIIVKSCEALHGVMTEFTKVKKTDAISQLIVQINDYEEEGDRLFIKAQRRLYVEERENPMCVLVWSRIFGSLEKCCDACEHAADTVNSVLLKNA